jgi:hypothetical protein
LGEVAGIVATLPGGGERFSAEYAACAAIAAEKSVSLEAVQVAAKQAFAAGGR